MYFNSKEVIAMPKTTQDRKWEAENDARTLTEADTIKKDSSRLRAASGAARRMAKEEKVRLDSLRKVAGLKSVTGKKK